MIDFEDLYFHWLCNLVNDEENRSAQYGKLLYFLYQSDWIWIHPMDVNREDDGLRMRMEFADCMKISHAMAYDIFARKQCSVLEMMVALAIRCETDIMADPEEGRRVPVWFWNMINSLQLSGQYDHIFNEEYVSFVLNNFIGRTYNSDGKGGLFWIPGSDLELNNKELWVQLNIWLTYNYNRK